MFLMITEKEMQEVVNLTNAAGAGGVLTESDIDHLTYAAARVFLLMLGINVISDELDERSDLQ